MSVQDSGRDDTLPAPVSGGEVTLAAGTGGPVTANADHRELVEVDPRHYVRGAEIARGGMGRIIEARDLRLGRTVALKELLAPSGELRARFEREARITARLQHPAIVNIIEAGTWPGGEPFYAMKLVTGESLDKVVARTKTLTGRLGILSNVLAVVDALAYAHSRRVIHRDLKPANVLVGDFGETVVIDWGLAKDLNDTSGAPDVSAGPYRQSAGAPGATVDGTVMGTPAYMPPEQALGDAVDERADVYALGAVLYHVLAGVPPYDGKTSDVLLAKVVAGPPVSIVERAPGVPPDLATIVERAMEREAGRRPSARELGDELRRFQTGKLVAAHAYSTWELVRRFLARHRAVVTVVAGAVAVIAVLATISISGVVRERAAAEAGRADAQRQRAVAEERVADLLHEQGRQELLAGRAQRAAVLLAAAYAQHRAPPPSLRLLVASAARRVGRRVHAVDGVAASHPSGTLVIRDGAGYALTRAGNGAARVPLAAALPPDAVLDLVAGGALVAAEAGATVWLFDGRDGRMLSRVDHGAEVTALAVDVQGDRILLLTGGVDAVARLWDGRSGAALRTFTPREREADIGADSVALTAGGGRVAMGRSALSGVLWDGGTGRVLAEPEMAGHVAFIPDDSRLLASMVGSNFLYDSLTGRELGMIGEGFSHEAFFPDSKRVVIAGQGAPQVIDAATARALVTLWKPERSLGNQIDIGPIDVFAIEVSPDGTRVAMTAGDSTDVWVCDAATGELVAGFVGHRDPVQVVAFDATGARLVTGGDDATVRVWESSSGRLLATIETSVAPADVWFGVDGKTVHALVGGRLEVHDAAPEALVASQPGERAVYSDDGAALVIADRSRLRILDGASGALRHELAGHGDDIVALATDRRGRVLSADKRGGTRVWELGGGQSIATLAHGGPLATAAISADGALVATAGERRVVLWDSASGQRRYALEHPFEISTVVIDPTGERLVARDRTGEAWLWSTRTGTVIGRYVATDVFFRDAVFSPDGSMLATCTNDEARLWNASTGQLVAGPFRLPPTPDAPGTYFARLVFSPDGRWLALVSSAKAQLLVDVASGRIATTLLDAAIVDGPVFSPDSGLVAAVGGEGSVRLLDPATGRLVVHLPHEHGAGGVWFVRDGAFVVTESRGTMRVWDLTGRLLGELPSRFDSTTLAHHLAIHPDGSRLAAFESELDAVDQFRLWDMSLETRPAAGVVAEVQARSPWRLLESRLVPATPTAGD